MIKPYLPDMTKSELHAVMTGGFATIAGKQDIAWSYYTCGFTNLCSYQAVSWPPTSALVFLPPIFCLPRSCQPQQLWLMQSSSIQKLRSLRLQLKTWLFLRVSLTNLKCISVCIPCWQHCWLPDCIPCICCISQWTAWLVWMSCRGSFPFI